MQLPSTSFLTHFKQGACSALFFMGMVISSLFMGPVLMLAIVLPLRWRHALARQWVHFNLWSLKMLCGLDYHVTGLENIPDSGAAVILCKHQSAWETLALQVIFPPLVFVLKKELLSIPVWGWAMATLKPIAINRGQRAKAMRQILASGQERLAEGLWVVLFPEGTRVAAGTPTRFASSGSTLAHKAGVPVIPVAHNAGSYWKRQGFYKKPGVIEICIGPPVYPDGLNVQTINTTAEAWVEARMQELEQRSET